VAPYSTPVETSITSTAATNPVVAGAPHAHPNSHGFRIHSREACASCGHARGDGVSDVQPFLTVCVAGFSAVSRYIEATADRDTQARSATNDVTNGVAEAAQGGGSMDDARGPTGILVMGLHVRVERRIPGAVLDLSPVPAAIAPTFATRAGGDRRRDSSSTPVPILGAASTQRVDRRHSISVNSRRFACSS